MMLKMLYMAKKTNKQTDKQTNKKKKTKNKPFTTIIVRNLSNYQKKKKKKNLS